MSNSTKKDLALIRKYYNWCNSNKKRNEDSSTKTLSVGLITNDTSSKTYWNFAPDFYSTFNRQERRRLKMLGVLKEDKEEDE